MKEGLEPVARVKPEAAVIDALRALLSWQSLVLQVGDEPLFLTPESVVRWLALLDRGADATEMSAKELAAPLPTLSAKASLKAVLAKMSRKGAKYVVLRTKEGYRALTPRSLFSTLSRDFSLSDLGSFLLDSPRLKVGRNTTVRGLIRRMAKSRSCYAAIVHGGRFEGVVSIRSIVASLLEEEMLERLKKSGAGYLLELAAAYLPREPVEVEVPARRDEVVRVLSKWGCLALVRHRHLEIFVCDSALHSYCIEVLAERRLSGV